MGLRDDLRRFREVGEERRQDLADFIRHGDLSGGDIRVPIKLVELPEFVYDPRDTGGVGQGRGGTPDPGDPVGEPEAAADDGDGDDAGTGAGEHGYYEMDPEEFARELDEELGLDLEPKGKAVVEETAGEFTDVSRTGPASTLDVEHLFTEGLKRKLATDFDEEYVTEALRVEGWGPDDVYGWARRQNIPVSRAWLVERRDELDPEERDRWPSVEAMADAVERTTTAQRIREEGVRHVPLRREDERYRHPEVVRRPERNAVVVNIRDVSGSMGEEKRDLVERVFTPLDWYLQGKYDRAEFLYVAHDSDAWEVERDAFFGIRSGGGTRISSAYELARELLEEYPFSEWNRFVFAAGDGENSHRDTEQNVIPLVEAIDANRHAYVQTRPGEESRTGTHGRELEAAFADAEDVTVAYVGGSDDVLDAIRDVLTTEAATDGD
jgi:uncharacterized sporulation protein YeaH/YhbH (DUF444 family)